MNSDPERECFWAVWYDRTAGERGVATEGLPKWAKDSPVGIQCIVVLNEMLERRDLSQIDRMLGAVNPERLDPVIILHLLNLTTMDEFKNRDSFCTRAASALVKQVGPERAAGIMERRTS